MPDKINVRKVLKALDSMHKIQLSIRKSQKILEQLSKQKISPDNTARIAALNNEINSQMERHYKYCEAFVGLLERNNGTKDDWYSTCHGRTTMALAAHKELIQKQKNIIANPSNKPTQIPSLGQNTHPTTHRAIVSKPEKLGTPLQPRIAARNPFAQNGLLVTREILYRVEKYTSKKFLNSLEATEKKQNTAFNEIEARSARLGEGTNVFVNKLFSATDGLGPNESDTANLLRKYQEESAATLNIKIPPAPTGPVRPRW